MTQEALPDSAGPSSPPPQLPEGWIAQWEGVSRKWYYVQRTTGQSQWEVPTSPLVPTPSSTPMSTGAGPSQAPPSRPSTSSPQTGGWPGAGNPGAGPTGDADRGIITDFLTSHIKPQQGGLAQMALGVIGRFSNSNSGKPGGQQAQHNKPHAFHQSGQQQQTPFGYPSNASPGVYTGAAPQYQPPGQTNMPPGGSQQIQSNFQQDNSSLQGGLSAPFGQNPPQSQTGQGSNSTPAMSTATNTTPSQGQAGPPNASPLPWQGGQQPPLPMEMKPSQPPPHVGLSSPAAAELPTQNPQSYGSSDVQMHDNTPTPQPPAHRPPSSNHSSFAPPATSQSAHPPPNGITTPGHPQNSQAGNSNTFQPQVAELAGDMPNNVQNPPPSQPAPNHGHANSLPYGINSGPPPGSSGPPSYVPPNAYAANAQYPNYPPHQPGAENGFGPNGHYPPSGPPPGPGYGSAPPMPMGHYGNGHYGAPPNQPNPMWNNQPYHGHPGAFPPRPMTGTSSPHQMNSGSYSGYYPPPHGGPPDQYSGPHGSQGPPPQHGYQAYHPPPSQAPGHGDPWGRPPAEPPRTAPSDPQFVSGPFTAGTPSNYGNSQPPYGGYSSHR